MRIADLTLARFADPRGAREILVVTLTTDTGLIGTGFANASAATGVLAADLITRLLRPLVVGHDAFLHEDLWWRMYDGVASRVGRRGLVMSCLAAVDFAVWDLKARTAGVPLGDLLGGHRARIPTYANAGHAGSPDEVARHCAEYVARGHTAVKIRATGLELEEATRRVEAVREAIGPATKLMVDVNGTWTPDVAIRQLKRWERFDIYWLEEPAAPDDLVGYKRVRERAGATFIAGGEQHVGVGEFRALLEAGIDIAQPNAAATGGITDWLRIYHLCSAFSVAVSPWNLQPVHIHMAAALPNVRWIEYFLPDNPLYDFQSRLWRGPRMREVRDASGVYLLPPDAPGLGLELDPDEAERARVVQ